MSCHLSCQCNLSHDSNIRSRRMKFHLLAPPRFLLFKECRFTRLLKDLLSTASLFTLWKKTKKKTSSMTKKEGTFHRWVIFIISPFSDHSLYLFLAPDHPPMKGIDVWAVLYFLAQAQAWQLDGQACNSALEWSIWWIHEQWQGKKDR